ncbi:hypothetical protein JXA32_09640 [Candidatus Sumerlaeota bacterium]|nr:hypothetical protein [Candidatus Sumerlaeota bacterium]
MITNEILQEKYRVQKCLSEQAKDMHEYFVQIDRDVEELAKKYGFKIKTAASIAASKKMG